MTTRIDRYRRGHWAETLAAWSLRLRLYRIVARRYKTKYGEIDLVAVRSGVIAFIEVKARPTRGDGLLAITPMAQARIARAAQHFVQRHPTYQNYVWRFDAVVVSRALWPYHMPDAWRQS